MSELADRLAYTEQPLYGYIENDLGAPEFTWDAAALLTGAGLLNKGRSILGNVTRSIMNLGKNKLLGGVNNEYLKNVDDGVERVFLEKPEAEEYYQKLIDEYVPNEQKTEENINFEELSPQQKADLRNKWNEFAKNNFIGKTFKIQNYPSITFSSKNIKKDYLHNLPEYQNLAENLAKSKYRFTTNFKKEKDRIYDHLINNENGLFDYLSEVVQDKNGVISRRYKMMKNIKRGDKP